VGRRIGRKIFENIGGWLMEICFYTRKCIFWRFVVLSKEFPPPSYISICALACFKRTLQKLKQ
jgi:hypothetical protein